MSPIQIVTTVEEGLALIEQKTSSRLRRCCLKLIIQAKILTAQTKTIFSHTFAMVNVLLTLPPLRSAIFEFVKTRLECSPNLIRFGRILSACASSS